MNANEHSHEHAKETSPRAGDEALLLTQFAVDKAPVAVYWIDRNAKFVYVNEAACRSLEYSREELLQLGVPDIDPTWPMEKWEATWEDNRQRGSTTFETVHRTKHGREFPVEITASFIEYGGKTIDCAYARDISERKRAEEALRKANRTLAALSRVNEVLVRAADESELLREVCQVIVDVGGYRMAWVGFAVGDDAKTVRPVAQAGHVNGYLDQIKVTYSDDEWGRGPVGRAMRTGQLASVKDVATDPSFSAWREAATERGYGCCVALPLVVEKQVVGVICLYLQEPGCLDEAEEKLLSQLASDLSYGITSLRVMRARSADEAERRKLEQQLEEHKRRFYRETIWSVTDGKLNICDFSDISPYISAACLKMDVRRTSDVGLVRKKVEAFLGGQGLCGDELCTFTIGVGEAITNAIKHGVRGRVYAGATDGELWVGVRDMGSGIESLILPRAVLRRGFSTKPSLGLGYSIMLDVADSMLLTTGARGTAVVLIKSRLRDSGERSLDAIADSWGGMAE